MAPPPPTVLRGDRLELVPLRPEHAAPLFAVAEPGLFVHSTARPVTWTDTAFAAAIAAACHDPGRQAFAMRTLADDTLVGSSSFLDFRLDHRGVEIGATWIARPWQGTFVNPESKLLLLRHAFADLGMVRVQLKTDARNVQSQRAMEKLGCVREGVLRQHMILPDGFVRDTVMYSITAGEWPAVEAGLQRRLRP
ncbi:MAG: GNAT family protein [Planctomycetota bacterium]